MPYVLRRRLDFNSDPNPGVGDSQDGVNAPELAQSSSVGLKTVALSLGGPQGSVAGMHAGYAD